MGFDSGNRNEAVGTLLRLKIAGEGSDDWEPGTRVGELGHRGSEVGGKELGGYGSGEVLEDEIGWVLGSGEMLEDEMGPRNTRNRKEGEERRRIKK